MRNSILKSKKICAYHGLKGNRDVVEGMVYMMKSRTENRDLRNTTRRNIRIIKVYITFYTERTG